MLFSSDVFMFAFLPVAVLGYYLLGLTGRRPAALWLVVASFFFYGWWNPAYIALLLASITFNYLCGLAIVTGAASPRRQTAVLVFAIVADLAALCYYKYLFPFLDFLHGLGVAGPVSQVVLPLGISFFTFTQIGYLIDCRQGMAKERGVIEYFLFATFFPHLIAGPILHHSEIMPQFARRETYRLKMENISVGTTIFVLGLAKKVLLADSLATTADTGFAHPETLRFLGAWSAVLSYSLQLYFDFSGYSDMAIGLARIFGVGFPLNFDSPYKARCIIDFWQRWHMTLTRYITLYLYNPVSLWVTRARVARGLGVSRKATATLGGFASLVALPTLFTMAIAGIWHGAGLQFLVFGLLHGCYLCVNHAWRIWGPRGPQTQRPAMQAAAVACGQWFITYLAVLVGQIYFRSTSTSAATTMMAGIVGLHGIDFHGVDLPSPGGETLPISAAFAGGHGQLLHALELAALLGIACVLPNTQQIMARFAPTISKFHATVRSAWQWQPSVSWGFVIAMLFLLAVTGKLGNPARFLYFQF